MKFQTLILYSLLTFCLLFQVSFAQSFPQSVIRHMATRNMRYHHYMWHQVRENWNSFSSSTKREFRNIGWEPPNPSEDSSGRSITNNYAGEDFLYMHRQMINTARQVASQNRESTSALSGWTSIPAPGDRSYPVPPAFTRGSTSNYLSEYKTSSRYDSMKRQEDRLKDASRLRRMTLNDLGLEIEGGIHNAMHLRWSAASSVGYRGGSVSNDVPYINKQWDTTRYDYLADSYASHVNPIFWKLHGWIDDRVEDWRRANGLSSIRWKGVWVGGPMSNIEYLWDKKEVATSFRVPDQGGEPREVVHDTMSEVGRIFAREGLESSFADIVLLEPPPKIMKSKMSTKTRAKTRRLCRTKPKRVRSRLF